MGIPIEYDQINWSEVESVQIGEIPNIDILISIIRTGIVLSTSQINTPFQIFLIKKIEFD